ncbi:hypothetical protein ONO23_05503 [Micromonospora noduli]|uniref:hypothetical protein n=1 Tax=Micromonospora noduli TaxID=709876 RepID=UPI000DC038E5|nr:hypothetical protein [Micromonospora noduli]RAO26100.1 hypothetical protein ONO23_05503 [Micromonospora noduli]
MTHHSEAVAALDAAISTVTAWCDHVRQDAEQRMGVPAGAESVIGDPWYGEALEIRPDLTTCAAGSPTRATDLRLIKSRLATIKRTAT